MEFVTTRDAAARLGVSTRQVQHLAAAGDLHLVARGLIDRTSLERRLAARQGSPRRAWMEPTAWGAVALLSGREADWLGASQRSRLRGSLRGLRPEVLVGRARDRATVRRYAGHSSAADRLRAELVDTSPGASSLGLAGVDRIDGYVAEGQLDRVVTQHSLVETDDGRYTLRATDMDLDLVADLADASTVLVALDFAESLDVRERRIGLDTLGTALRWFRG